MRRVCFSFGTSVHVAQITLLVWNVHVAQIRFRKVLPMDFDHQQLIIEVGYEYLLASHRAAMRKNVVTEEVWCGCANSWI